MTPSNTGARGCSPKPPKLNSSGVLSLHTHNILFKDYFIIIHNFVNSLIKTTSSDPMILKNSMQTFKFFLNVYLYFLNLIKNVK